MFHPGFGNRVMLQSATVIRRDGENEEGWLWFQIKRKECIKFSKAVHAP